MGLIRYEIDTTAAAFMAGVPAHTIRNWASRGHLQPLRADGTRTTYDAEAVIRTAARFGYLPDPSKERDVKCCVPHCKSITWPDVPVPLCQEHAVAIWLHVNDEIDRRRTPRPDPPPSPQPVVYFVLADDRIKIGTSTCLPYRLRVLRNGSGRDLETLLVLPGGRLEERRVHALFAADRVRGEWFMPSAPLLAFIAERQEQDIRDTCGID